MVTLFPEAANQCSSSSQQYWGKLEKLGLGQPSPVVGKGREGWYPGPGQEGRREFSRWRSS